MPTERRTLVVLAAGLLLAATACGGGTAALAGGSGGGGSPKKNSAPSVPVLEVPAGLSELSPATIRFTLADPEGNPISVKLEYEHPAGSGLKDMTLAGEGELVDLPTSAAGVTHAAEWDFAADLGTSSLSKNVHVVLTATGGQGKVVPGTVLGDVLAAFGNNPAQITDSTPPVGPGGEVVGIAKITFRVADDSGHDVSIVPEYRLAGAPDWLAATPAGQLPDSFAAPPGGVSVDFFWDVPADLGSSEHDVEFRFTADDGFTLATGPLVPGAPVAFRVDNNAAPSVDLNAEVLILDPDERRGIPVPFTVSDPEGDPVRVVLQWRHEQEPFPALPSDVTAIEEILTDPVQRQAHRIATPFPAYVGGRALPKGPAAVELPELAGSAASLLEVADLPAAGLPPSQALTGRQLELLRPSIVPAAVARTWASNPLVDPVAVLPEGDGLLALVLDRPAVAQWRLRRIELATGAVMDEIAASDTGTPSALAWEPGRRSVLVADHLSSLLWQVQRVDLQTGAVVPLVGVRDGDQLGFVRGIAPLAMGAALATLGSSLLRLEYAQGASPRIVTLRSGLQTPWGVVLDPQRSQHVYVAERGPSEPASGDVGRVLSFALDSGQATSVVAQLGGAPAFLRPTDLALERSGARLLVLTDVDPEDGERELRAVDLGGAAAGDAYEIRGDLPADAAGLASGPDGLLLLALGAADDLAVGGGLQQRRTVAGYDPATRVVAVGQAFAPELQAGQPWRMTTTRVESPLPGSRQLPWDSRDVPSGGEVWLGLSVLDSDLGAIEEMQAPKRVRAGLDGAATLILGDTKNEYPRTAIPADMDGDGDLDLACGTWGHTLDVFWQTGTRAFDPSPLSLGSFYTNADPRSVAAADLDGDGDKDLVSANYHYQNSNLTVFWQTRRGTFDPVPLALGGPGATALPTSVAAADLDGDGDLDLVSANEYGINYGSDLTVFWQTDPGIFAPVPLSLQIPAPGFVGPVSVSAADLDGDGDLDLVSANRGVSAAVVVFWQTAPGVFDPVPLSLGEPGTTSHPSSVAAADLDGDGDTDLVSAMFPTTVFWQTEPGVFDPEPLDLLGSGAFGTFGGDRCVTAADVDGDSDLDIVVSYGNQVAVIWQTSPGHFDPEPLLAPPGSSNPWSVAAADLDGDGLLDLVSAGDVLRVSWHTSARAFEDPVSILAYPFAYPLSASAADVDGDGDHDLVAGLAVFWQEIAGTFDPVPLLFAGAEGFARSVSAADIDGDGDLDLLSANDHPSNTLRVTWQTATGTFDPVPLSVGDITTSFGPVSVAAADLDGDGDLDLVSANQVGDTLTVFWQTAPGTFDPVPSTLGDATTTDYVSSVAAADLDGDGDLDLASANLVSDTLTVFWQTSAGTFDPVPLSLDVPATSGPYPFSSPVWVSAGDLDGDGDLDLASANLSSYTLTVFWQTAPGVFDPIPLVLGDSATTPGPRSVAPADLDGDGDLDLALAKYDTLAVFWQTGPRVFDPAPQSLDRGPSFAGPQSVAAADLDGDGDQDLVSANPKDSTLTVFFNAH